MTTTFRDEIRETVSPHKFGGSRRAAMLWLLFMEGGEDESATWADDGEHAERFGKRILIADSQGFVSAERYRSAEHASERMHYYHALERLSG
jgi:hypothetical protein